MIRSVMLATAGLATAAAAQQAQTVQQAFEAAAALDRSGTPAARLAAWEALERRVANNKRNRALARVRKSAALLALDRKDEAIAAARAGLSELPASDLSLREDRFLAQLALAQVAEAALDYATAADSYRIAEATAETLNEKASVWIGLIRTETFVDPGRAAATMVRADKALTGVKVEPKLAATFRRLDAERLLNGGDFAGAQREARAAVKLLGGLTERTDLDDVAARSDYAIAAMLAGKTDAAREYLAMSGAGRISKGSFDPGIAMRAPDCGGEAGLKPADMAVVEFSIGDDGSVIRSTPVYAAGGGAVALEFARAALDWSWTPEQVKALPPFFRYRARVEMRCSTAFDRPSVGDYLDGRLGAWLAERDIPLASPPEGSDALVLPGQRANLAAIEARNGARSLQLVPALQMIARNRVAPREEAHAAAVRALAIADANAISGAPRLAIELGEWGTRDADRWRDEDFITLGQTALAGRYAADPEARAAIRMILAQALRRSAQRARQYLAQVAADTALAEGNPLRAAALVQLASLEQEQGDAAAAKAAFDKSGLAADQCSIVDKPPRLVKVGGTFPNEAMQWGFEGWTQVQFDISADGKVLNERAVISYPPFVFTGAGRKTIAGARYEKSYRPDGGLGCGGSTQRVRFVMP